jgi:hypothetical protein
MSRADRRALERQEASIRRAFVATLPDCLETVPRADWPPHPDLDAPMPLEVWRSRRWVVQVYAVPGGGSRISVQRTNGADGITWDELMAVKREIGRGAEVAVELYPPDHLVVNVANMRHLWTVPEMPVWAWRRA